MTNRDTTQTVYISVDSLVGGWALRWSNKYHKCVPFFLDTLSIDTTWDVPPVVVDEVDLRVEDENELH